MLFEQLLHWLCNIQRSSILQENGNSRKYGLGSLRKTPTEGTPPTDPGLTSGQLALTLQTTCKKNDSIQTYSLLMCWNDFVTQKALPAFIIVDASNRTHRTHFLEKQWPYNKWCHQPAQHCVIPLQCNNTFAEWSGAGTGACANVFSPFRILQICELKNSWRKK